MSASTYSLLKKALSSKTSKTRNDNWVKFQKEAHLKDKGILKQVKKAVENGVSEKRAHDLITVIYSSKKRNMIPDFDAPRNVSLKSSGSIKSSNRFTKSQKRSRPKNVYDLEESVIPTKSRTLGDPFEDDFRVVSGGKTAFTLNPEVMQYIFNGDVEGLSQRLSSIEVSQMFNSRIQTSSLDDNSLLYVRDFLVNSAKLVKNTILSNSYPPELIKDIQKIHTYKEDYEKGLRPDTTEVSTCFARIIGALQTYNTNLRSAEPVDTAFILSQFENISAEAVTQERQAREELEKQNEASQIFKEEVLKAETDSVEAKQKFDNLKQTYDRQSSVESYIHDELNKSNIQTEMNKAAEDHKTAEAKAQTFTRMHNLSQASAKFVETKLNNGEFGGQKRHVVEKVIDLVLNTIEKRLKKNEGAKKVRKESFKTLLESLPVVQEALLCNAKNLGESLSNKVTEDAELASKQARLRENQEAQVQSKNNIADAQENVEAYSNAIKQTAFERIHGNGGAKTTEYRMKRSQNEETIKKEKENLSKLVKEEAEIKADITATKAKRESYEKEADAANKFQENANLANDLMKNGSNMADDIDEKTYVEMETVNLGKNHINNMNKQADATSKMEYNSEIKNYYEVHFDSENLRRWGEKNQVDSKIQTLQEQLVILNNQAAEARKQKFKDLGYDADADPKTLKPDDRLAVQQFLLPYQNWYHQITYDLNNAIESSNKLAKLLNIDSSNNGVAVDESWKLPPNWFFEQSPRVIIPNSTATVGPEQTLKLIQAKTTPWSGYTIGAQKISKKEIFGKKPSGVKSGVYLVGKRPDPFLNLSFWKNLYNKTKK